MYVLTIIIIGMGVVPTGWLLRDTTPVVNAITVDKTQFSFESDCLNAEKAFEAKLKVQNVTAITNCTYVR
jgi:hypothetical protein